MTRRELIKGAMVLPGATALKAIAERLPSPEGGRRNATSAVVNIETSAGTVEFRPHPLFDKPKKGHNVTSNYFECEGETKTEPCPAGKKFYRMINGEWVLIGVALNEGGKA